MVVSMSMNMGLRYGAYRVVYRKASRHAAAWRINVKVDWFGCFFRLEKQ